MMLYCTNCGSRRIEIAAWIQANDWQDMRDGTVTGSGDEGPSGSTWCQNCEDPHTGYTDDRQWAAEARQNYRQQKAQGAA